MALPLAGFGRVWRRLFRTPLFTAVSILTLGVGIGANTAIFSVLYGVLLKPLPFAEPDRLVGMWHTAPGLDIDLFTQSPSTYFTYRDENRVFEDVGLWAPFPEVSITGRGEPERVETLYVTDGTLPVLNVQPLLGRLFTKADDAPGSPDRTVLTYGYWQRRFGGARDIVGQAVTIDGKPHEVIGVLPASFRFLDRNPAVLLPFRFNRAEIFLGNFSYLGIARLKPGVTIAQANKDVARMIPLTLERFAPPPGFTRQVFDTPQRRQGSAPARVIGAVERNHVGARFHQGTGRLERGRDDGLATRVGDLLNPNDWHAHRLADRVNVDRAVGPDASRTSRDRSTGEACHERWVPNEILLRRLAGDDEASLQVVAKGGK
ncbi:MAG: hypothetical protein GEV06_18890 [Luteitalea sp.]|nr:hypothetical protein [Luteitalea sp.]